jgi:peptidoglycan/xylan/chitin deacetylase (PgdA/CDA1 family)
MRRIPATIMVTGAWIRLNPDGVAFLRAHLDLFAVENHGHRHLAPVLGARSVYGVTSVGDLAGLRREVERGAADIVAAFGVRPDWYRGATGLYSPDLLRSLGADGVRVAGYNLNGDMGASLPRRTVARRIAAAADGDIVVAHINQPGRESGAGVADGIAALASRGMGFVRLDKLGPEDVVYETRGGV